MWHAAALVIFCASPSSACCGPTGCQHNPAAAPSERAAGLATSFDSPNFHVVSFARGHDARSIAQCCESWRQHLQEKWLGNVSVEGWSPRCEVIVHGRRDTYGAAIGRGGEATFGSSMIDSKGGRITIRRIDLLIDQQGTISALGHELTHVVIADVFPDSRPPAWANEGAAVLADSADKQRLHKRDLDYSVRRQTVFHCAELLQMATYPQPHRVPTFYGQSASLIAFLGDVGGPEKLLPFVKDAMNDGYDLALREHYGIQSVVELQQRWLASSRL